MQDQQEIDLLRQAQNGDMEAFGELQSLLDSPIRRFVWRLIGTHDAEDDIVQDSLIALYLNLDRISPPENLRPYLFRIVRNRCYDLLRKRRRFEHLSLDEEPVEAWVSLHTDDGNGPEEMTDWLMLHLEVQQAINKLPELQRQTLILYSQENLAYNEIAEVMNCSIGTVKSRLFYAKKTLRQFISPETLKILETEFKSGEENREALPA
ncbi:MAG: RNA polymerase sigma factor [Anaerolineae bacterium]|nr:RNA polymerase sigma factor [Anaerolineae bacterium]